MSQPTEQQDPRITPPKKFGNDPAPRKSGGDMADDQSDAQGAHDRDVTDKDAAREKQSMGRPDSAGRAKGQPAAPSTHKAE